MENRRWWLPRKRSAWIFALGYTLAWLIVLLMPVLTPFGEVNLLFGWLPGYNFWATMSQFVMFIFMIITFVVEESEGLPHRQPVKSSSDRGETV